MHTRTLSTILCVVFFAGAASVQSTALAQPETKPGAPADRTEAAKEAFAKLKPQAQKLVAEHAQFFVVGPDGRFWDRQLWLERQERRERLRKQATTRRSDRDRALGATAFAPMDRDDPAGGILRLEGVNSEWPLDRLADTTAWKRKAGTGRLVLTDEEMPNDARYATAYYFETDFTNPPLYYAMGGHTAITNEEIREELARPDPAPPVPPGKQPQATPPKHSRPPMPLGRPVTNEELALAVRARTADLSRFVFKRTVLVHKSGDVTRLPTKNERSSTGGAAIAVRGPQTVEFADFVWTRHPLPVPGLAGAK